MKSVMATQDGFGVEQPLWRVPVWRSESKLCSMPDLAKVGVPGGAGRVLPSTYGDSLGAPTQLSLVKLTLATK